MSKFGKRIILLLLWLLLSSLEHSSFTRYVNLFIGLEKFSNKPKHLIITSLDGLLSSSGVFFFPFCSLLLTLFCMSRERYTSSYKYLDFPTQITILLDIGCERSILEEEERDWARTKWGETEYLFQHQHLNCWNEIKPKIFCDKSTPMKVWERRIICCNEHLDINDWLNLTFLVLPDHQCGRGWGSVQGNSNG